MGKSRLRMITWLAQGHRARKSRRQVLRCLDLKHALSEGSQTEACRPSSPHMQNKQGRTPYSITFAWLFGEGKSGHIYLRSHLLYRHSYMIRWDVPSAWALKVKSREEATGAQPDPQHEFIRRSPVLVSYGCYNELPHLHPAFAFLEEGETHDFPSWPFTRSLWDKYTSKPLGYGSLPPPGQS